MRGLHVLTLVVVFAAACAACGERGSSPAAPSAPPATATAPATALVVTGPDVVLTGQRVIYDATATLSNGATIYHANETWNTDNAAIATINNHGVLTGQGQGTTTVTATYRGKSATFTVRVSASTSNPFPGSANLVISFRPDPVPGSLGPCLDREKQAPNWSYIEVFTETQGVGFTWQLETLNLYTEDGLLQTETSRATFYSPPNSEFVEDLFGPTCTTLGGSPSGFVEEIVDGVDDRGNQLTFRSRLRLLPVAGVSPNADLISLHPVAPGAIVRALRRLR